MRALSLSRVACKPSTRLIDVFIDDLSTIYMLFVNSECVTPTVTQRPRPIAVYRLTI